MFFKRPLSLFTLSYMSRYSIIFNSVKPPSFAKRAHYDSETQKAFGNINWHFTHYFKNDQKNMEILKDLLFKLHLITNKRGKHEEFSTDFNSILDKLNEKTMKPFLTNSLLQTSFEKAVLDILKTIFLFKYLLFTS